MWLQVTSSPKEDVKSSNNRLKGRREGTFHLVSQEDKKWIFLEMFESIKEYNLYCTKSLISQNVPSSVNGMEKVLRRRRLVYRFRYIQ